MTDAQPGTHGTVHPIVRYGDPVLHRPCEPVTEFDDALATLVEDMFASMYAVEGVGLAANQIGVGARVFVLDCRDADSRRTVAHVVNPTLIESPPPRELMIGDEGCLSVPGQFAELARVSYAEVTGFDIHGEAVTVAGTGQLARCLQHETDHLDGTVYVDRLPKRVRKKVLNAAGLSPK